MNDSNPRPPSDSDLDRLLASRVKRTSPEFEMRWRELRAGFAGRAEHPRAREWRWLLWPGLSLGAFAAIMTVLLLRPQPETRPEPSLVTMEELIALDAALAPATVLLEPEHREALLHLPAQP